MQQIAFTNGANLLVLALSIVSFSVPAYAAEKQQKQDDAVPAETQVIPPKGNAGEMKSVFLKRNDPGNIEKLARGFSELLILDDRSLSSDQSLRGRPELKKIAELSREGRHDEFLKGFQKYFIGKLRNISVKANAEADEEAHKKDADVAKSIKTADELLQNMAYIGGRKYDIGPPGTVNWNSSILAKAIDGRTFIPREFWSGGLFTPLLKAYMQTGDRKYLEKWEAYMDDWAMNEDFILKYKMFPFDYNFTVRRAAVHILPFLNDIALLKESDQENLSSATFARILSKYIFYPLQDVAYARYYPRNWCIESYPEIMELSMRLDEFKAARFYFTEARRGVELYATTHNMPDGTENQQMNGYNFMYVSFGSKVYRMMEKKLQSGPIDDVEPQIDWDAYLREMKENMNDRLVRMLHITTPNGEAPIGHRTDHRNYLDACITEANQWNQELMKDPENGKFYNLATQGRSKLKGPAPTLTSEYFPYGGYYMMRAGWEPNSPYLFMFCSTHPGASSGFMSERNNNAIGLRAYGQDMIEMGPNGSAYVHKNSPIRVDGFEQCFHLGLGAPEAAWDEPSDFRWSSGDIFDFAEGIYAGPYGQRDMGEQGDSPKERVSKNVESLRKSIRGLKHQRFVFFIKDGGICVVADRLFSAKKHSYSQDWRLPVGTEHGKKQTSLFSENDIRTDSASKTIRTESNGTANISFYQFCRMPISYKTKYEKSKLFDMKLVSAEWNSDGDSQIITLICPRKDMQELVQEIRPVDDRVGKVSGFQAILKDGRRITYISTQDKGSLDSEGISAYGESLLLVSSGDMTTGAAIGCDKLLFEGKNVMTSGADFEFICSPKDGLRMKHGIYRPVPQVKIIPERNIFIGKQEISLKSQAEGTDVYYTVDGSEPSLSSLKYTKPFIIEDSACIKAKAVRRGMEKLPPTLGGTEASATARAIYTRSTPLKPSTPGNPKEGLSYKYYEGNWKEMWLFPERLSPKRTGTSKGLFNMPEKTRDSAYMYVYSGFIDVPETGIYVFHAPEHYMKNNLAAGYELEIRVDGRTWYPSTRRHAFGTWSIPLEKGLHSFEAKYLDYREDAVSQCNDPGLRLNWIWDGEKPPLLLSGPGLDKGPVPDSFLKH